MKTIHKLIPLSMLIMFSFALYSCDKQTKLPTIELDPTKEVTEDVSKTPLVDETPTQENTKEDEVIEMPKTIIIYLDIDWEGITEVYFNDTVMVYGPYDNDCEFMVEIESESITKFDLDFKQHNSWWHVQDTYQSWNCDSFVEVDMKVGETYIVKDVNWTYQWDNEEQKWYTCTINKQ